MASALPVVLPFLPIAFLPVRMGVVRVSQRGLRRTASVRMPEGPECTVHAERLNAACGGQQLMRAEILSGRYHPAGKAPASWDLLQSSLPATVDAVRSKGKFIWWCLKPEEDEDGASHLSLWSTLGMTGMWSRSRGAHARLLVELKTSEGARELLYYNDQRNFGTIVRHTHTHALDPRTRGPPLGFPTPYACARMSYVHFAHRHMPNDRICPPHRRSAQTPRNSMQSSRHSVHPGSPRVACHGRTFRRSSLSSAAQSAVATCPWPSS